jgi:hypothetical protein
LVVAEGVPSAAKIAPYKVLKNQHEAILHLAKKELQFSCVKLKITFAKAGGQQGQGYSGIV